MFNRQLAGFSVLILAVFSLSWPAAAQTSAESAISEFDVNGLKVLFKKRESSPTVSAGLFIRGGVRNQTPENAGIEAMTLAVAVESSKKFPRQVMQREFSRTGTSIGAGASRDFGVISLASTRAHFGSAWEMFVDAFLNPTFAPSDLELVRERTLTGFRNQSVSPDNYLGVLQDKVIYEGHPYAVDASGTPETIAKFKPADLAAYHKTLLNTSRLLLVIVGDLESAEVKKLAEGAFGKLPRGDYKETALPPVTFAKTTVDITPRGVPTNYIRGIFAAPPLGHPDYYAMRVAMTLLQSRVHQEIRVRRNLSYAPNAEMDNFAANTANIYVTTVDANTTIPLMLEEIEQMKRREVDADTFSGVAGFFLTTYYLSQESNAAQVADLAQYELFGGGWRNSLQFLDKIRSVTPSDVRAVSNKYMKNLRFVVIGDPAAINKERFMIASGGQ